MARAPGAAGAPAWGCLPLHAGSGQRLLGSVSAAWRGRPPRGPGPCLWGAPGLGWGRGAGWGLTLPPCPASSSCPGRGDAADADPSQLPGVLAQQARRPLHPLAGRRQLERELPPHQCEGARAGGAGVLGPQARCPHPCPPRCACRRTRSRPARTAKPRTPLRITAKVSVGCPGHAHWPQAPPLSWPHP